MYLRRSAVTKYFIAAYLLTTLYCEWLVYETQPLFWPELKCENEESCVKILFIADPQLQGDLAEPTPLNYLYNWDSDRYLKSTFSVVAKHFKPDVLVYLGDLMDEGSISSMQKFHHYAKRLFNIFELNYPVTQVWLPGDNDIGGENEPIKQDKVKEFHKIFNQPSIVSHGNISFYKVNGITFEYPRLGEGNQYRIVVSHYPVTVRHVFGHQVNKEIRPNIYFCAHEHESKYIVQELDLSDQKTHQFDTHKTVLKVPVGTDKQRKVYEIYVPTCSYRMGTFKIGYGAAVLDEKGEELSYAVLWSPGRFPPLLVYAALLALAAAYCLVYCAARLCRRHTHWTSDKVPLLERT